MKERKFFDRGINGMKIDGRGHQGTVSMSLLVIGVIVLVSGLVYMAMNLNRSDDIVAVWVPVMIAGLVLVFLSQVMVWRKPDRRRRVR